jgi:DNA-binding PadR family transcriptional regulator
MARRKSVPFTLKDLMKARKLSNFGDYYEVTRNFMPLRLLEFHILLILNICPNYPYGLIEYIGSVSNGVCQPKCSTIYKTTHRLCDKGLIELEVGKIRRYKVLKRTYYLITPLGKRVLARQVKWLFTALQFVRQTKMISITAGK